VSPRAALVVGLVVLVLAGAGLLLTALAHQFSASVSAVLIAATFAVAGVVVARQQPRNVIGWLFLTATLTLIVAIDASGYLVLRNRDHLILVGTHEATRLRTSEFCLL
jgi:hypothetical protein